MTRGSFADMRTAIFALLVLAGCRDASVNRELGARCTASSECDDRCLSPSGDYPDGFCTVACNTSQECPSGSTCVDREGGVCLFDCQFDAGCDFLGATWICKDTRTREDERIRVNVCRGD